MNKSSRSTEMKGRVCVVTGATAGIGRVAARELSRMGADVVIVCRDRERGEQTRGEILAAFPGASVELAVAELSSQAAVRSLAMDLLARFPRIHVLINNAGLVNARREVTADGFERTFAVNHLAPFLLTNLLLDRMIESAPARIINVSSDAHRWSPLNFDDLQSERSYRTMSVYGRSKLCNVLFTRELARRLSGKGVTVTSMHPGAVATQLGQNNGKWAARIIKLFRPFFRTAEQGADTIVYLASSPEVEGVTGEYFVDRKVRATSKAGYDREAAERLFRVSAELTGVKA